LESLSPEKQSRPGRGSVSALASARENRRGAKKKVAIVLEHSKIPVRRLIREALLFLDCGALTPLLFLCFLEEKHPRQSGVKAPQSKKSQSRGAMAN
jgi:hypothetical protein